MGDKTYSENTGDKYGYKLLSDESSNKRLDLNDLLERAKTQKKTEKRNNFLIFSVAIVVVTVVFFILNF